MLKKTVSLEMDILSTQNEVLRDLSLAVRKSSLSLTSTLELILDVAANFLDVQIASVWFFNENKRELRCRLSFDTRNKKFHVLEKPLKQELFPEYFELCQSERCIDASDAMSDPRTIEFSKSYFPEKNISSVIDCPIYIGSSTRGVLTFQHTGPKTSWNEENKSFAISIADLISLSIAHHDRLEAAAFIDSGLEATMQGVLVINKAGKLVRFNNLAEKMFACSHQEMLYQPVENFLVDTMNADGGIIYNALQQDGFKPEYNKSKNLFARKKSGEIFPIEISVSFITNRRAPHVLVLIEDVSEQHSTQTKLIESETLYRNIVDDYLGFILRADDKGKITFANKALCDFIGPEQDDILNAFIYKFIPEDEHYIVKEAVNQLSVSNPVVQYMHRMISHNTDFILSSWTSRAIYNSEDILVGYQAIGRDVTQEQENELRLAESQRLESLAVMSGGIAHDFNNLLTPILGYTDLVKTGLPQELEQVKYLDYVMNAALRARDLAKQVLIFSRKEEVSDRSPIETGAIIIDILEFIQASTSARIKFNINVDATTGVIRANPSDLYQILSNLCTNSVQAMLAGGELDISISAVQRNNKNYLQFIVSDTGEGIPDEIKDRIFEPFFTTKTRRRGTGLGLSVVRGLIEELGGQIECQSTPGLGTSFVTYIPCLDVDLEPELKINSSSVRLCGDERILVVDDDKTIAGFLRDGLEQLGYHVSVRTSANEALSVFMNSPNEFDILITDFTMPYMTGLELTWNIRKERPDLPVVLISGYSQLLSEEELARADINACIDKPFLIEEMAVILRKALS